MNRKRYLRFDPGYVQLLGAIRGVSGVLILLATGLYLVKLREPTLMFTALCTVFSLINLYQPNRLEKLKSIIFAQLLLSLSCLFGLYTKMPHLFKEILFLSMVFFSYFLAPFNKRFKFHPVIASVLVLVSSKLNFPGGTTDPIAACVSFMCLAILVNICLQFIILPDRFFRGFRDSLANLFDCWEESIDSLMKRGKVDVNQHQISHHYLHQLIMFHQRLALPLALKKELNPLIATCISISDAFTLLGTSMANEPNLLGDTQRALNRLRETFTTQNLVKPLPICQEESLDYPLIALIVSLQNQISKCRAQQQCKII